MKMKRIKLSHGSARVSDLISPETIEALNQMSERAFKMETKCTGCDTLESELPELKKNNSNMVACCPDNNYQLNNN